MEEIMSDQKIYEYQSDWFQSFQEFLEKKKINREDKFSIKVNIIESNQTLEELGKRFKNEIEVIKSKEDFFYTIKIKNKKGFEKFLYVDTNSKKSRFWIIHNIEFKKEVKTDIEKIFQNSYKQDSIYLTKEAMEYYRSEVSSYSLGLGIKFDNKFTSKSIDSTDSDKTFKDGGFTLRFWTKYPESTNNLIKSFNKIDFPINYNSVNCVFEDEDHEILMKEDLYSNGVITVQKGKDLKTHTDFVNKIRNDYSKKMDIVESNRIDWENFEGDLFYIKFKNEYNPKTLIENLNKNYEDFKIHAIFMYSNDNNYQFHCVDGHTGSKFYLTASKEGLQINLSKKSCGNIIFRLYSNLQQFLDPDIELYINNDKLKWD